LLVESCVSIGS